MLLTRVLCPRQLLGLVVLFGLAQVLEKKAAMRGCNRSPLTGAWAALAGLLRLRGSGHREPRSV